MYFSLDSVPDEQLTLDGAWMDDSVTFYLQQCVDHFHRSFLG